MLVSLFGFVGLQALNVSQAMKKHNIKITSGYPGGALMLNNVGLTEIEPGAFDGVYLSMIAINNNPITTIPMNAFKRVRGLTTLALGDNKIKTLEAGAFNGLSKVTDFYLGGNSGKIPTLEKVRLVVLKV